MVCQLDKDLVCQRLDTRFDVAVFPLRDTDGIRDLLLRQVMVFPQVFDPVFQIDTTFKEGSFMV